MNRYPLSKTLVSIKRANLLPLIMVTAIISLIVVIGGAIMVTWGSTYIIEIKLGWLDTLLNLFVGVISGVGAWFLFPVFSVLIAGAFQETVIRRVEEIYYPNSNGKETLFWADLLHDIKFTIWGLFLNILILPLYLLSIGFIVSIILNSYLLGREFFEGAAGYHIGKGMAKELLNKNKFPVYVGGLIVTTTSLIPILNLFIPIIAVVWMTHLYQAISNSHS